MDCIIVPELIVKPAIKDKPLVLPDENPSCFVKVYIPINRNPTNANNVNDEIKIYRSVTREEIKDRIAKLKIEKAIIEENGFVLTEAEAMDLECIINEISILRWVLN